MTEKDLDDLLSVFGCKETSVSFQAMNDTFIIYSK